MQHGQRADRTITGFAALAARLAALTEERFPALVVLAHSTC